MVTASKPAALDKKYNQKGCEREKELRARNNLIR